MTDSTSKEKVNPKITDAVTQTNVKVLGESPAVAMGSLYQTIANAIAMAAANAVYSQQQSNIVYQAVTTRCVRALIGGDGLEESIEVPENISEASASVIEEQIKILSEQLEKAKAERTDASKNAQKTPAKSNKVRQSRTEKKPPSKTSK